MIKRFFFWFPFFASFCVAYGVLYYDYSAYRSEDMIYVPLNKDRPVIKDGKFLLNFKVAPSIKDIGGFGGKAVVYINSFKVASVVRFAKSGEREKDLSFGERFLRYSVYRKVGLKPSPPSLYFAQRFYKIPKSWQKKDFALFDRVRYAVFIINKTTGRAALIGLTDRNFSPIKPSDF